MVRAYYQTGEEGPLGPVLTEVRTRLLALARGTFGVLDQERAEDLAQETIAYLLNSLRAKKYEDIGTLTAYAGTHLRFLFLNSRRYKPGYPGRHEDPFLLVNSTHATAAEELPVSDEAETQAATVVAAATQAVLGLDPGARAAVLLHYYQGLPVPQAAARLGITESSFGARLGSPAPLGCDGHAPQPRSVRRPASP